MTNKHSLNNDIIKINLGILDLNLPTNAQDDLRKDLTKLLKSVFADQDNTPEILQANLDKMEFVFVLWAWLEDDDFMVLLHKIPTHDLATLLRYMQKKTPNLIKRVHTFFDEATEEDIKERMQALDRIPAVKIVKILSNIYGYLGEMFGDILPSMPPDDYDEAKSKTRFTDISAYVKALPSVPPERGKVILQCLDLPQKVKLLNIANARRWKDFPDWFKQMESEQAFNEINSLQGRLPPQPLWEEMLLLEAIYNLMAPGAASNIKQQTQNKGDLEDATQISEEGQDKQAKKAISELEKKAKEFLHQVGKLSSSNLQPLLKQLTKENLVTLIAVVEKLNLTNLHDGIHGTMPANLYKQLVELKPQEIEAVQLQNLLKEINATIRKLKQEQ